MGFFKVTIWLYDRKKTVSLMAMTGRHAVNRVRAMAGHRGNFIHGSIVIGCKHNR